MHSRLLIGKQTDANCSYAAHTSFSDRAKPIVLNKHETPLRALSCTLSKVILFGQEGATEAALTWWPLLLRIIYWKKVMKSLLLA